MDDSFSRSSSVSPTPPPFSDANPRPDLAPATAESALRRLVALELQAAGFDAAEPGAIDDLEGIVWSFFESLLVHAHQLAELGRRRAPTLKDVIRSCEELGVGGVRELTDELEREKSYVVPETGIIYEKIRKAEAPALTLDSDSEPDDDDHPLSSSATSAALVAPFLPPLPSRHSYRQTPVFPKSSIAPPVRAPSSVVLQTPSSVALAHISTLRSRLSDSQLVAASLRNLIRKTSAREQTVSAIVEEDAAATGEGEDGGVQGKASGPRVPLDGVDDLVNFEEGWYAGGGRRGAKRTVSVVRVGAKSGEADDVGVGASSGVGGAAKRRKWRA